MFDISDNIIEFYKIIRNQFSFTMKLKIVQSLEMLEVLYKKRIFNREKIRKAPQQSLNKKKL
jgi:hypothetical protein